MDKAVIHLAILSCITKAMGHDMRGRPEGKNGARGVPARAQGTAVVDIAKLFERDASIESRLATEPAAEISPEAPTPQAGLFEIWCNIAEDDQDRKCFWTLNEKAGGREAIRARLASLIRSHYDRLERIAEDIKRLGYAQAANILQARLPETERAQSGDLGEILATELVEERTRFKVPVKRLRYKDGREMALRGDDFIGVASGGELILLKGESKSRKKLNKSTITEARGALNEYDGRCTPASLLFVADRLLESNDEADVELGRAIRDEVGLKSNNPDHMFFTFSGNVAPAALHQDFEAVGTDRDHYVVNLRVEDHADFIAMLYAKVQDLGND